MKRTLSTVIRAACLLPLLCSVSAVTLWSAAAAAAHDSVPLRAASVRLTGGPRSLSAPVGAGVVVRLRVGTRHGREGL